MYPVAGFPEVARSHGARIIEVNPERTPITLLADVFVEGRAGETLPRLVDAFTGLRSS